jgi:hypothetical protein
MGTNEINLDFDMSLRFLSGHHEAAGKVSLYRGPILLAYDQEFNSFDEDAMPKADLTLLAQAKPVARVIRHAGASSTPWVLLKLPTVDGTSLTLCDFATAGANGTRYRSWLATTNSPPSALITRIPFDGGTVSTAGARFQWTGSSSSVAPALSYQFLVAANTEFSNPIINLWGLTSNSLYLNADQLKPCSTNLSYYWQIVAVNSHGRTVSTGPPAKFTLSAALPADAKSPPLDRLSLLLNAPEMVQTDGKSQKFRHRIAAFPEEGYSVALRMRVDEFPEDHLGQVLSGWTAATDDPLRLCIEGGKLFARIEAGQNYSTAGIPVETGRWMNVVVVRSEDKLALFIDGQERGSCSLPLFLQSTSTEIALGGNPRYAGNEYLHGAFSDLKVYARALDSSEVLDALK